MQPDAIPPGQPPFGGIAAGAWTVSFLIQRGCIRACFSCPTELRLPNISALPPFLEKKSTPHLQSSASVKKPAGSPRTLPSIGKPAGSPKLSLCKGTSSVSQSPTCPASTVQAPELGCHLGGFGVEPSGVQAAGGSASPQVLGHFTGHLRPLPADVSFPRSLRPA